MKIFRSRKDKYIQKLLERAHYHEDLAKRLEDDGDEYASDIASVIADVFKLVAGELEKI